MSHQPKLPGFSSKRIVNVASVKHRSPFRYPGGKTWLVPWIKLWMANLSFRPTEFIEPFAGGSIVGLSVAFEGLADRVILAEIDEQVGAVWQAIIEEEHGPWLADQIEQFDLTPENVNELLTRQDLPLREQAFRTIVHNRVSRGGILAKGAGLIKYGENGKGIASRWYPQTLAKRIRDINKISDRLSFVWGDGLEVIVQNQKQPDIAFFIDPPYTAGKGKRAGRRLYAHSEVDHDRLFELMETVQGDFLITYDNDEDVQQMAIRHGFNFRTVPMKSTHHTKMYELLIGRNLDWVGDHT